MSRVDWHPTAREDLLHIYDWIADRADPDTAYDHVSQIEAHCEKLSAFPRRGSIRALPGDGVRTGTYRRRIVIAYRVDSDHVLVLRLVHAARDLPTLWQDVL